MEEELTSLKRTLISLVVSSPTTMTVNRLVKDYRNMVGGALPIAMFGFRDFITFLRERCQDIFVLEGPQWDPILTPKISKNLKHIDQMVQRQRVQSSIKFKGKRRSIPSSMNPPVELNMIASTFNVKKENHKTNDIRNPVSVETKRETPVTMAKTKITPVKEYNESRHDCIINQNGYNKPPDNYTPLKTSLYNNDKENINKNSIIKNCPSSALSKFYKKRLPYYNSDMDFPISDADCASKGSTDSSASQSSSSKQAHLDDLKSEIIELIKDSSQGVWFTDLMRIYKEKYGRELKFDRFGLTSLGNLVSSLESHVSITRPEPSGDYLLQDPNQASAMCARGGFGGGGGAPRSRVAPRSLVARGREPDRDREDALPGVEFEADVFPSDCVHYLESIQAASVAALAGGEQLEVLVGEVYSPSHFWILRVAPEHSMAMEQIMDEMTEYYRGEGAGRVLARGALRVGQYCAAVYERDWHRALIVQLIDSDTVKVRHVDYGTVDSVCASGLKPLRREWAALPAQAVRARLAGCRPAGGGGRWPRAACAAFLHRVRDKRLYANIVAVDREEDIVETFLTDTSGAEDACLTRELTRAGHADKRTDSALRSEDCYLYPLFEALEAGATPNYAEICRILVDGLSLDYVDAYRRHVPDPWPASAAPPAPAAPAAPSLEGSMRALQLQHGDEVRLTEAEWTSLMYLRAADPHAAHCYLLTAAWRSLTSPPPGF